MTLDKVLDYINLILNKEQKGNVFSPDRFNTSLQAANITLFERLYEKANEVVGDKTQPLYNILLNNRAMRRFIVPATTTYSQNYGFTFPPLGRELLKAEISFNSLNPGERYKCTIVSEEKFEKIRFSMLETPSSDEFYAVQRGSWIVVVPTTAYGAGVVMPIVYLREPVTPVYDYCIGNDTDRIYYMPPTSIIEDAHLKLGGTILQHNVIHPSGATDNYTSTSVELDWDRSMHIAFANEILLMAGINIQDPLTFQFAQSERQQVK